MRIQAPYCIRDYATAWRRSCSTLPKPIGLLQPSDLATQEKHSTQNGLKDHFPEMDVARSTHLNIEMIKHTPKSKATSTKLKRNTALNITFCEPWLIACTPSNQGIELTEHRNSSCFLSLTQVWHVPSPHF